ncbi:hypothetical protein FIBSPDRAFT_871715 [Athelia psychrophila]|uniref:Uncharacterized protein n=1 Tax=Athelia psychrophila TaxID=1759441 RepID=A0A166A3G6_9AGAM|nr:hypothetical protein FIBSPDRAFT_871715 [Fibularhizoctonia sp. CBS 109695]
MIWTNCGLRPVAISFAYDRPVPSPIHRSIFSANSASDADDSADSINSRVHLLPSRMCL